MFGALRIRNFRFFAASQLTSTTSVWMQRIAGDWIVMELTGSVAMVGFLVLAQLGPWFLLGPFGGVLADRYNKRLIMMVAQIVTGIAGALMAILLFTGFLEVWHIFVLAIVVGVMMVAEQPARLVFVGEITDAKTFSNAVSMNQAIFQISSMLGSTTSGILLSTIEYAWPFVITFVGHFFSVALLLMIRTSELHPIDRAPKSNGQLAEVLRFIASKREMRWIFFLVIVYSLFANPWPVVLAPMADAVFVTGAEGYGRYNAALATGALLGAVFSMRRDTPRMHGMVLAMATAATLRAASAFMPNELIFMTAVAASGIFAVLMWTAVNPLLQLSATVAMRGRVIALFLVAVFGGDALGSPLLGVMADMFGARSTIFFSGLLPAILTIIAFLVLKPNKK